MSCWEWPTLCLPDALSANRFDPIRLESLRAYRDAHLTQTARVDDWAALLAHADRSLRFESRTSATTLQSNRELRPSRRLHRRIGPLRRIERLHRTRDACCVSICTVLEQLGEACIPEHCEMCIPDGSNCGQKASRACGATRAFANRRFRSDPRDGRCSADASFVAAARREPQPQRPALELRLAAAPRRDGLTCRRTCLPAHPLPATTRARRSEEIFVGWSEAGAAGHAWQA